MGARGEAEREGGPRGREGHGVGGGAGRGGAGGGARGSEAGAERGGVRGRAGREGGRQWAGAPLGTLRAASAPAARLSSSHQELTQGIRETSAPPPHGNLELVPPLAQRGGRTALPERLCVSQLHKVGFSRPLRDSP